MINSIKEINDYFDNISQTDLIKTLENCGLKNPIDKVEYKFDTQELYINDKLVKTYPEELHTSMCSSHLLHKGDY